MITPELKDSVLNALCQNCQPERMVNFKTEDLGIDISFNDLDAILSQFQRLGLISELNSRPIAIFLYLNLEALDFWRIGGFSIQELATKQTLEKLRLEVEALKNTYPEKADTFTSILANIATITTFFMPR